MRSASSASCGAPPPRRRPTSEWPSMYLVVECIDDVEAVLQRALDVGAGEGVVADGDDAARAGRARPPRSGRPASAADWSGSPPRSAACLGVIAASSAPTSAQVDEAETRARPSACARSRTAGSCRRRGRRWRSMCEPASSSSSSVRGGGQAGGEGEARGPALQVGQRAPAARSASGSGCASTRSPGARRGSTGRRSRWRRSAASPRRSSGSGRWPPWMTRVAKRARLLSSLMLGVASSRHAAAQIVEQVDAGDEPQELTAVA